jgi:hypothetical protein
MIEPQMTTPLHDQTTKTTPPDDRRTAKTTPPQKEPFRHLPQHMLANSQPLDNTGYFGRQWASSCSGKHGFGPAPLIVFCRHVYLHSIGTMMGFHTVTLWQNETCPPHFLYHMNIIIQTHLNSRMGKMEANNTSERA